MSKWLEKRSTFTIAVGAVAVLMIFGTGTAVAGSLITSAKIKNNTIQSIDVKTNTLKSSDVRDSSLRGNDIADGSLGGADVLDRSLSNNDVSVYYAAVLADGTLGPNSGGVTINKTGTGEYVVDFGRSIGTCAVTATVGSPTSAVEVHGEADVTAQLFNVEGVHVYTRAAGLTTATDLPFMVNAVC